MVWGVGTVPELTGAERCVMGELEVLAVLRERWAWVVVCGRAEDCVPVRGLGVEAEEVPVGLAVEDGEVVSG